MEIITYFTKNHTHLNINFYLQSRHTLRKTNSAFQTVNIYAILRCKPHPGHEIQKPKARIVLNYENAVWVKTKILKSRCIGHFDIIRSFEWLHLISNGIPL